MKTFTLIRFFAFLLFFFSLSIQSEAQIDSLGTKNANLSEIRKNAYQVELGFSRLRSIWDNTSSATILFKKKYNYGKLIEVNSLNFIRAFTTINTQINFTDNPVENTVDSSFVRYHPADRFNIAMGVGLERQFQNRRFVHYYGMDVFGRYFKNNGSFSYIFYNGTVGLDDTDTLDEKIQTISAGVLPFFGLKYYITDQFSIGVESGFELSYFNTVIKTELISRTLFYHPDNTVTQVSYYSDFEPVVSNGLKFDFFGIRYITLGYTFK